MVSGDLPDRCVHFALVSQPHPVPTGVDHGGVPVPERGVLHVRGGVLLHALDLDYLRADPVGRFAWWRWLRQHVLSHPDRCTGGQARVRDDGYVHLGLGRHCTGRYRRHTVAQCDL